MKTKIQSLILVLIFVSAFAFNNADAQVKTNYTFSQASGTYTPLTGGIVVATATDNSGSANSLDDITYTYPAGTIPFNFPYDGGTYTGFTIETNGCISFGTPVSGGTYSPLSSTGISSGIIAPFGRDLCAIFDLGGFTGDIQYKAVSATEFVIQYSGFRPWSSSLPEAYWRWNFQVRLKSTGEVRFVYDPNMFGAPTATTAQVGLRGPNNTFLNNVNNRLVTTGTHTWATSVVGTTNASTCEASTTNIPVSGLNYIFTPPAGLPNDMQAQAFVSPLNGVIINPFTTFSPTATFRNSGTNSQSTIPVSYEIAGTGYISSPPANIAGPMISAATNVTFAPLVGGLAAGTYTIKAKVSLVDDGNTANDEITGTLIVQAPLTGIYTIGLPDFNRVTGKNITSERVVKKVMKEFPEYAPVKKNKNSNLSEVSASRENGKIVKMVTREVEEVSYVLMENGKEYKGPQFDAGSGNFTTLTAATTALNSVGGTGAVTFLLIDPDYPTENYPIVINNPNASAVNTLTVKPASDVNATISGVSVSNAIIKVLSGYTTIDGSNSGGTSRDLSITNTDATSPTVVHIASTGAATLNAVTLKNCNITNGVSSSAVVISDASSAGTGGYFTNISVQNNNIKKAFVGLWSFFVVAAGNGAGCDFSSNVLNSTGTDNIDRIGIYVQGGNGVNISNNDIGNFEKLSGEIDAGVWCDIGTSNTTVQKNVIHGLGDVAGFGYGGKGVVINSEVAASNITVSNNMIYDITGDGDSYALYGALYNPVGIYVFGAGTSGVNLYYNSIYMFGNTLDFSPAGYSVGIGLDDGASATVFNNSVQNNCGVLSAGVGAVGIACEISSAQLISSNNNNFYCSATSGTNSVGKIAGADYSTIPTWAEASEQDGASIRANPNYISTTNLHVSLATSSPLNNKGVVVGAVTTDIDGNSRVHAGWNTDIGADEFTGTYSLSLKVGIEYCPVSDIKVTLYNVSCGLLGSQTVSLTSPGPVNVNFPGINSISSAFIKVQQISSLAVESATSSNLSSNSSAAFDFTTAQEKEWNANQIFTGGIWNMITGDVNQSENIDGSDASDTENDAISGVAGSVSGFLGTDVNCDGVVDAFDISTLDNISDGSYTFGGPCSPDSQVTGGKK